jgi:hypothetical protein
MPTFRIHDLIVAVGLGRRAAAPGPPNAPAPAGDESPGDRTRVEGGGGCLGGTNALYVCLDSPSVLPQCGGSTHPIVCPTYSAALLCGGSTHPIPPCAYSTAPALAGGYPGLEYIYGRTHPCPPDAVGCMSSEELTLLKRQLNETLQLVEQREDQLRRGVEYKARDPQPGELEDLERRLSEALEEVRRRRPA